MANQTGTFTKLRAKKTVIEEDRYDRYEVTGTTADAIKGEVFIRKGTAFTAGETLTLTAA